MKEVQFSFYVYPVTEGFVNELLEKLQSALLAAVEAEGLYMGPVEAGDVQDGGASDGDEAD